MYHALIIDDEQDARGVLRRLLEMFCPEVTKISEAATAEESLALARVNTINIAFIDIQLKRDNGLELAEKLSDFIPNLIFVTAFDKYAVNAFQTPAIHYLLKPVDPELLQQAVAKARASDEQSNGSQDKILLVTKQEHIALLQEEIDYIKGEGNYCTFHCKDDRHYLVSKNLAHYEEQLVSRFFFRIHQSYVVRVNAVREVINESGFFAVLANGTKLPIARRRKDEFVGLL